MDVNPYQSPRTEAPPAARRRTGLALFLLTLLSLPAAAIAGSATCQGLAFAMRGSQGDVGFLLVGLSWAVAFLIVVGSLSLERAKSALPQPRMRSLLLWTLLSQVLAAPTGFAAGAIIVGLVYNGTKGDDAWFMYTIPVAAAVACFICAVSAYCAWRWRERKLAGGK